MGDLARLPNIGAVLERNLLAVGIVTPEDLYRLGSREAFLRIRHEVDAGACLHMLYGLEGAVRGIPDSELTREERDSHKDFLRGLSHPPTGE